MPNASPLFDDRRRSDSSPALYSEDSFTFLNRAAGEAWERIRDVLDDCYSAFPDGDGDLRARFRSTDPRQHYAAWWELYLHQLLRMLDFKVTVHPEMAGTSGRPDFLAERGIDSFYVEAVTIFSGIVATGRRGRLEAAVQDVVNTIDASEFMVGLAYEQVGQSMPAKSAITRPIEEWLATLDADELLEAHENGTIGDTQLIEFGDWELRLRPIARSREFRGRPDNRLIGMGPTSAGFTNDTLQIARALTRKKRRYGIPDRPLVVAALPMNGFVDDRDVQNALFGSEAVRMHVATGATTMVRSPDGVWVGKRGPAAKRMSALLMGVGITPNTCATKMPQLWHHFDPTHALDVDLPFSTARVVDEAIQFSDATRSASDVFGLPPDWPGPLFPRNT